MIKQKNNQVNFNNFRCNRQNKNIQAAKVNNNSNIPVKNIGKVAVEKTKVLPGLAVK